MIKTAAIFSSVHLNPVRVRRQGLGKSQVRRSRAVGVEPLSREQVRERVQALRRFAARVAKDRGLARLLERATREMHNE